MTDTIATQPTAAYAINGGLGPMIISPVEDLVMKMRSANPDQQPTLAREILAVDRDCIEAYLVLVGEVEDVDEAISMLTRAMEAGNRLLRPLAEEYGDAMSWSGFPYTRPFMRAIHLLGRAYEAVDECAAAARCYETLLLMEPRDAVGARFDLARIREEGLVPDPEQTSAMRM
jgi:hypothetical protein